MANVAPIPADTDAGLVELSDWVGLPHFRTDRYQQFSSYNRRPGTWPFEPGGKDFNNFIARSAAAPQVLLGYVDETRPVDAALGGYVLAAVDDGPGFVARMFFTRFTLTEAFAGPRFFELPDLGRFDREDAADLRRWPGAADTGGAGRGAGHHGAIFGAAGRADGRGRGQLRADQLSAAAADCVGGRAAPLAGYYYHVDVKRIDEPTRPFSGELTQDPTYAAAATLLSGSLPGPEPNDGDWQQVIEVPAHGEALVLADAGGGTVTQLRLVAGADAAAQLADVALRVWYEDAAAPAIDVPLDAFCAAREGAAPLSTTALQVSTPNGGITATLNLPILFGRSIRISLANGGPAAVPLQMAGRLVRALPPEPWGYLHARSFSVAGPQPEGTEFGVLNVRGRGRYVGTMLFAAGASGCNGRSVTGRAEYSGGQRTRYDRRRGADPAARGPRGLLQRRLLLRAGPVRQPRSPQANVVRGGIDGDAGVVSCCRWHVLSDAIDFSTSFDLRFQYGDNRPGLVERYATVAYYYLDRPDPGDVTGGSVCARAMKRQAVDVQLDLRVAVS